MTVASRSLVKNAVIITPSTETIKAKVFANVPLRGHEECRVYSEEIRSHCTFVCTTVIPRYFLEFSVILGI